MLKIAAAVLVLLVLVTTVYARVPFILDATVDKVNRSLGFHDIFDVLDTLNEAPLTKTSPIDLLTGIAGHLDQPMTMSNNALGSNHSSTGTEAETLHYFGFGMCFGQYSTRGFDSTVVTTPLNYTITTIHGLGFVFDLPMTLAYTDSAHAYNASLGFGVRLPISRLLRFDRDEWDITPLARAGTAGTPKMASVGLVYALHMDITDLVARYATIPLHVRDRRIDAMFLPHPITFWPFPSKKLSIKVHRYTFNWGRAFCPPSKGFSFNLRYTF
ncbi:MAG TPA: hypothetical protein VI542_02900 [Candidatus Tectomicrobia bacterium]